jgi:hypothetical protein
MFVVFKWSIITFIGYLEEAKCDKTAQSFLEHSPHLSECLAVNKEGKGFNTRPAGYSLTDILDEYCEIRSMGKYWQLSEMDSRCHEFQTFARLCRRRSSFQLHTGIFNFVRCSILFMVLI